MFAYRHLVSLSLVCLMAGAAQAGPLPDRVAKAAAERVAAGQYPVLVIAVVDGDKSQIALTACCRTASPPMPTPFSRSVRPPRPLPPRS